MELEHHGLLSRPPSRTQSADRSLYLFRACANSMADQSHLGPPPVSAWESQELRLELKTSISIIIPAYNVEASIGTTLSGLGECQSRAEVLVVDDGSTDC